MSVGAEQSNEGVIGQIGAMPGGLSMEMFDAVMAEFDRAIASQARINEALVAQVRSLEAENQHKTQLLAKQARLVALGEMAAGVAHEIRNPLGGISLYLEMLANDVSGHAQAAALCTKISSAVGRLNHTVEAILGFTRQIEPQSVAVDPRWLVDESISYARPLIDGAGLRVAVHVGDGVGQFQADAQLLHQAMLNLLRNAAEASPPGGVVEVSVSRSGTGMVELSVRDHGSGIPAAIVDRLFTPFASTKKGGTGLGLALCQRIAEAHGGAIMGMNHADGGAVFRISLPDAGGGRE